MSLCPRPLVYFWIAEYTDGVCLPQFDPETGRENRFADIDTSKLRRFGWHPFSAEFAKRIYEAEAIITVPSSNSSHMVDLKSGDCLVAKRENRVAIGMHDGGVCRGETIYVLGVKGSKILRIHEDGSVE